MRMKKQSLTPSVQNGEEPDFGAEVFGIGGNLEQGLGGGPETACRKSESYSARPRVLGDEAG